MENHEANQAAFDKVVRHLLKQKKRSLMDPEFTNWPTCAYRGPGGLMCAVGPLIPDGEYSPDFEDHAVEKILHSVPSLRRLNLDLLIDLQAVHDDGTVETWAEQLAEVADRHGLTMPALEPSP